MAIKGSLKEASLADVCQLLSMGQKTGCLSVTDRSRFGQIYFERGRITYATVLNRRDRLGDLLVGDGLLTHERLAEVIREQESRPDLRLGELLVERGLVETSQIERFIRLQIEEAIYHLFTWSRGSFFFEVDERPDAAELSVSINPESVLLEGARRVDEWSLIEKKIPSADLMFGLDAERLEASDVELTSEQQRLLPLLDGTRSMQEVIEQTGLGEFEVGKAIYGLLQAGFAHQVGRRAGRAAGRAGGLEADEHRNLGVAFYRTGMLDEAEAEFQRVLESQPEDLPARHHLALLALRQGRYAEAVRRLKKLIESRGPSISAFVNLAQALRLSGRASDALLVLEHADRLEPRHPAVALQRAWTLFAADREADAAAAAAEYAGRLSEGESPAAPYFYLAGLLAAVAGRLEEAGRLAAEGLERHPESAPLLLLAGVVAERRGDLSGAERHCRQAVEEDPDLVQAHKCLGDVAYRTARHDQAAEHYERAAALDPDLGDDLYAKLGNLSYKLRRHEDAMRHWRRALELNPDNRVVRNNLHVVTNVDA